jgi:hypothetical protein
VKVHAPYDAATLSRKLGLQSPIGARGAALPDEFMAQPRPRAKGFEATRPR